MTFPHAQEVIILKRKNMFFCLLTALCLLLTGCGGTAPGFARARDGLGGPRGEREAGGVRWQRVSG